MPFITQNRSNIEYDKNEMRTFEIIIFNTQQLDIKRKSNRIPKKKKIYHIRYMDFMRLSRISNAKQNNEGEKTRT